MESAAGTIAQVAAAAAADIAALDEKKQDKTTGAAGQVAAYTKVFSASEWEGDETKTISIPASEHGISGWPSVQIYEKSGSGYISGTWGTMAVLVQVDAGRNITLSYENTAFPGMAVITG